MDCPFSVPTLLGGSYLLPTDGVGGESRYLTSVSER